VAVIDIEPLYANYKLKDLIIYSPLIPEVSSYTEILTFGSK
jgi:hypothetical protein